MDYIYYSLIILCLLAIVIFLVRLPGHASLANDPMSLANAARQRRLKEQKLKRDSTLKGASVEYQNKQKNPVIQRELSNIRTPWGWPTHGNSESTQNGAHDTYDAMHRFTDKLMRGKTTVDDQAYQEKRSACLKALLEDRYGRASKMTEIDYRKIKAPRLRDPQAAHDQMDNFLNGKSEQLTAKLKRTTRKHTGSVRPVRTEAGPAVRTNLKTPWGW